MPALANSKVGSEWGTTDEDGTGHSLENSYSCFQGISLPKVWPFSPKNSKNVSRTRLAGHKGDFSLLEAISDRFERYVGLVWR